MRISSVRFMKLSYSHAHCSSLHTLYARFCTAGYVLAAILSRFCGDTQLGPVLYAYAGSTITLQLGVPIRKKSASSAPALGSLPATLPRCRHGLRSVFSPSSSRSVAHGCCSLASWASQRPTRRWLPTRCACARSTTHRSSRQRRKKSSWRARKHGSSNSSDNIGSGCSSGGSDS
eukprot:SAG25_NODE_1484_length_2931_cov_3.076271_1_plen_175_part_00